MRDIDKKINDVARRNRNDDKMIVNFDSNKDGIFTIKKSDIVKIGLFEVVALDKTSQTLCIIDSTYISDKTIDTLNFCVVQSLFGDSAFVTFENLVVVRYKTGTIVTAGTELELSTEEGEIGTFKDYELGLVKAIVVSDSENFSYIDNIIGVRLLRGGSGSGGGYASYFKGVAGTTFQRVKVSNGHDLTSSIAGYAVINDEEFAVAVDEVICTAGGCIYMESTLSAERVLSTPVYKYSTAERPTVEDGKLKIVLFLVSWSDGKVSGIKQVHYGDIHGYIFGICLEAV